MPPAPPGVVEQRGGDGAQVLRSGGVCMSGEWRIARRIARTKALRTPPVIAAPAMHRPLVEAEGRTGLRAEGAAQSASVIMLAAPPLNASPSPGSPSAVSISTQQGLARSGRRRVRIPVMRASIPRCCARPARATTLEQSPRPAESRGA
jgi:hypothetical protein